MSIFFHKSIGIRAVARCLTVQFWNNKIKSTRNKLLFKSTQPNKTKIHICVKVTMLLFSTSTCLLDLDLTDIILQWKKTLTKQLENNTAMTILSPILRLETKDGRKEVYPLSVGRWLAENSLDWDSNGFSFTRNKCGLENFEVTTQTLTFALISQTTLLNVEMADSDRLAIKILGNGKECPSELDLTDETCSQ